MSFLNGAGAGAAAGGAGVAADGLGKLLGTDGATVGSWADRIGKGMNQIAQAGGAPAGYDAAPPQAAPQNNYLQTIDPGVIRALIAKFGPAQNVGTIR